MIRGCIACGRGGRDALARVRRVGAPRLPARVAGAAPRRGHRDLARWRERESPAGEGAYSSPEGPGTGKEAGVWFATPIPAGGLARHRLGILRYPAPPL